MLEAELSGRLILLPLQCLDGVDVFLSYVLLQPLSYLHEHHASVEDLEETRPLTQLQIGLLSFLL